VTIHRLSAMQHTTLFFIVSGIPNFVLATNVQNCFVMDTTKERRGGQTFISSKMDNAVAENSMNIVRQLSSRSVTEQRPPITVHRHHAYQLQLALGRSAVTRSFASCLQLKTFCSELITGCLEGCSSCIYDYSLYRSVLYFNMWDMVDKCMGFPSIDTYGSSTFLYILW
jgi:hypothetical protein